MHSKKSRHFAKSKTICFFYLQKVWHFRLRDFSWNFWNWYLYTKNMTLFVTWRFYIQKYRHFEKSKTICARFLIQKAWHFALHDLSWNFWNWRRVGDICIYKKMHFALHFHVQKTMQFVLHFILKKPDTLGYILICKKQCTLCYIFISIIYRIVLISNYKRTYDQINQIDE